MNRHDSEPGTPLAAAVELTVTQEALEKGIELDEIRLAYQPQVDAGGGRLVGFEALVRWHSDELGLVSPDQFVPLAERSQLINALWERILQQAEIGRQHLQGPTDSALHTALNLSAVQLQREGLGNDFAAWLSSSGLDASQVHIEITESALLSDAGTVFENLEVFRKIGVALWLDDFGTGFSSLRHLRDLPISGVKIDRSFVTHIEDNLDDFRIVSAIVAMSNSLGLQVVAEGVETDTQAQILTQLGCDLLQGYLIGRPASMAEVKQHWSKHG